MDKNLNEEHLFAAWRARSSQMSRYDIKTERNEKKKDFIDEYSKARLGYENNIQKLAQDFLLLERGIMPDSYFGIRNIVSSSEIEEIYEKIKNSANSDFVSFYKSYLKKIEYGYNQDFIDSALEDVKIAYSTLRKCSFLAWDCPDQMITIKEMENLYNILTNNKSCKDSIVVENSER